MINGSKMVADIGDSYSVERDAHGEWYLIDNSGKNIHLGDDDSAKEIAADISKLVAMWGRK